MPECVPTSAFRCQILNGDRHMSPNGISTEDVCKAAYRGDFELLVKRQMPCGQDPTEGKTALEMAQDWEWDVLDVLKKADMVSEPPYRFTGPEEKRTPLSSFILWKAGAADLFRRFMSFVVSQGYRVMLTKGTLLAALRFNSVGWYDAELDVRNLVDTDYDVVIMRPGAAPPKPNVHDPMFLKISQLLQTEPLFASYRQCGFALTHTERDWFDEDDIPISYRFGVYQVRTGKRFFRGLGLHIDLGIVYNVDGCIQCDREVYRNIGYESTNGVLPASTFDAGKGYLNLEGVHIPAINLWGYSAWRWSAQIREDAVATPSEDTLARALEWCAELRYPLIEQVEDSVYRCNSKYYTKTGSWEKFWDRAMSANDQSANNFHDLELNMRQIYHCLRAGC
mmetsp:Transcript_7334/g.16689  ORF Transcript_7334/g.16689 Transcript_7334/m.16689 type:complete len:394 (+) Transcript_7334:92-1273(+)